jgi:hypothetical protein
MTVGHDLGELGGASHDPVDITFGWFGEKIRVNPDFSNLMLFEFLDQAAVVDATNLVSSQRTTMTFLRNQIHPDDWDRFMTATKANRQQFDDLLTLSRSIVEAVTRFSSGRLSGSPAGQPNTEASSRGASSSVAYAMAQLRGRPDLKMAVWHAETARRAAAASAN